MRWTLPAGCLLIMVIILCGCIQSPSAGPVTPAPTGYVLVGTPLETLAPRHTGRVVNMTAEQTLDSVIVMIRGGDDAGSLVSLNVRITNLDGSMIQRTIMSPEVGRPYTIQYYRIANAAKINIVGTFSDGYQQTLLMNTL